MSIVNNDHDYFAFGWYRLSCMPNEQGRLKDNLAGSTGRRQMLRGLGAGALALPFTAGTSTAEQAGFDLSVTVQAGEGDADNWTPRDRLTDEFRARIDVSGLSSGTSKIVATTFPVGGSSMVDGGQVRTETVEVDWSSGYIIETESWSPGGIFGGWEEGMYRLYAAVAEDGEEAFGAAVSEPFEVAP